MNQGKYLFRLLLVVLIANLLFNCSDSKTNADKNETGFSSTTEEEYKLDKNWPYEEIFQQKKDMIITQIADNYTPPNANIGDPEKYYWPKALARFEKYGRDDSLANAYVELFKDNKPFHFVLVGTSRLLCQQPKSPAVLKHRTTFLKNGFARDDSYNPWTCEGTENHINMSRTGGYLFSQEAIRYNVGIENANEKLKMMKEWLGKWSKKIFYYGTGEWNSSTYSAYNMVGWLNLYDFAEDPDVRKMARAVLDYYACELALYYSFGTLGSAEMRGAGFNRSVFSSTGYLAWLWFGLNADFYNGQWKGSEYILCAHYADSRYRPPALAVKLANNQLTVPDYYRNSKPAYLLEKQSYIKEHFYIHPEYTLGTAYVPYGGWTGAASQMINWRLVINQNKPDNGLPYVVGGNGMFYEGFDGRKRQPWDQLAQHKNVFMITHKVPANYKQRLAEIDTIMEKWEKDFRRDFFTRFPNEEYKGKNHNVVSRGGTIINENKVYIQIQKDVNIEFDKNIAFVEFEKVYLAIQSLSLDKPILDPKAYHAATLLLDEAKIDKMCGLIMEVGTKEEFPAGYEAFKTAVKEKVSLKIDPNNADIFDYASTNGDIIKFHYQDTGSYMAPIVDWGYGPTQRHSFFESPPYLQPTWPTGKGTGRVPRYWVNGQEVDLRSTWPVYSGTNFELNKGVLTLSEKDEFFQINYIGDVPNFSTN